MGTLGQVQVGLIGPGIIGRPIAASLLRGGCRLVVHGRRREAAASLVEAGAAWAATPRELALQAEVVFTVLPDAAAVEQVLFGTDGVVAAGPAARATTGAGRLLIDMSTVSPQATRVFADRLAGHGIGMLDAPASGGEAAAIDATLSIMVGGPAAAFERARPLLELIGSHVVHVGDHGAGQVASACDQVIAAVTIEAVAEALTLARRLGADPARVRAALAGGFAASRVLDHQGGRMIARDFRPGLRAALQAESLGIAVESAHALGLDLPAAAFAAQQLNALAGAGEGDLDSAAMIKVLERMLGETR